MDEFAALYDQLDQTNSTSEKVDILVDYFVHANEDDKIFALALFCGRKSKRTIQMALLRKWAAELAEIPEWLFEESYHTVGDLAETIAGLTRQIKPIEERKLSNWMHAIVALDKKEELEKKAFILNAWSSMDFTQRFVFNKLLTGGFRVGVSQKLVEKALAKVLKIEESIVAHRLTGEWNPFDFSFQQLLSEENVGDHLSKPYPFYLAYAIDTKDFDQWKPQDWLAEWKWDGIRGQVICRKGELFIWSRGEELITPRFPEFSKLNELLPDGVVIDGELICMKDDIILPFQHLQTRIGRKNPSKKNMTEFPVAMIAYDLLEFEGKDIRNLPVVERRKILEQLVIHIPRSLIQLSQNITFNSWDELSAIRNASRAMNSEGLMLKRKDSTYKVGRKRGDWWKWKIDPMTVDAVMIYAMKGHGRRANLYTDYTFAVWNEQGNLVPFTKAYSGLTDKEILEVDDFVKKNTIEKFGPVRSVKAVQVFEIAFEGIQKSSRHKSGIALRFPRILRWRKDKKAEEADHIENLNKLLT